MQHNKSTIKKKGNNKYIDYKQVALKDKKSGLLRLMIELIFMFID